MKKGLGTKFAYAGILCGFACAYVVEHYEKKQIASQDYTSIAEVRESSNRRMMIGGGASLLVSFVGLGLYEKEKRQSSESG